MPHVELILGTAQLGLPYGKVNPSQPPSQDEAFALLDDAWDAGVRTLDTARGYGFAEERIGAWLQARGLPMRIATKPAPRAGEQRAAETARRLREELGCSCSALGVERVAVYLLHRGEELHFPRVAEELRKLTAELRVEAFGVSVYEPNELSAALAVEGLGTVQAPFSLFDRRIAETGALSQAAEKGVQVWARSLFLQGALFMAPETLPGYLEPLVSPLRQLRALASESGATLEALAMQAAGRQPGITGLVVGAHRPEQIRSLALALHAPVGDDVLEAALALGRGLPEQVLDPRRWPGTHGVSPMS